MSYDGIIMQRAIARFDQARQRREAELDQRRREVFARQPRLRDIDCTLRTTMSRIVAAAAKKGEDPLPALRVLRDENLSLQRERAALLEDMGYPADYLEDKPACSLCGDTGYTRSGVCACLKQYYAREQLAELSRLLPLGEARFDTFRFDLYDSAVWDSYGVSPRANMERNFDVCRDFARQFSRGSGSQETVTVQEIYPRYQGALLVCAGGDDPTVRLQLTEAMSALTGLGADKISISQGK